MSRSRQLGAAIGCSMLLTGALGAQAVTKEAPVASAGSVTAASDSADAARVVSSFHQALERGDSAAALALLAPDATILESGAVESVAEYRAHHLPADIEYARAVPGSRAPLRAQVRGDVAWVVGRSETKGEFRGRPVNSAGAELMVLTRGPGGWQIRAIHWSSRRRTS